MKMKISINGVVSQIDEPVTLAEIASGHKEDDSPFALALNGDFIPKEHYQQIYIKDGDKLDIVSPVGGG